MPFYICSEAENSSKPMLMQLTHTHTHSISFWILTRTGSCVFEAVAQLSEIPHAHSEEGVAGQNELRVLVHVFCECALQQVIYVSISALRMCSFSPDLRRPHLPSLPPPSCPSELLICVPQPSAQTN